MKQITLTILVSALVLSGCSSAPSSSDIAKEQIYAEKIVNSAAQDKAEAVLNSVPEWVLEPPKTDDTGVYAVGVGESKKIYLAMKLANLNAQFELSKAFGQEFTGNEKNFVRFDGLNETTEQYTQVIDSIVDSVPLSGFETVKQEAVTLDGTYTVYKLMKLSFKEFDRALQTSLSGSKKQEIEAAFNDLQSRLSAKNSISKNL
jgi:hypothetical protein